MSGGGKSDRFRIRFMRSGDVDRVAELIAALQAYQKMTQCPRIPTSEDLRGEITKLDSNGNFWPNLFGTFTAVAVDNTLQSNNDNSGVIGYLIYSKSFSIIQGSQLFVNSFFIDENYRRHGIGKRFIQFLKHHGELVGIRGFDVPVMNDNHFGQKFYESFGSYLVNEEYHLTRIDHNSLFAKQ